MFDSPNVVFGKAFSGRGTSGPRGRDSSPPDVAARSGRISVARSQSGKGLRWPSRRIAPPHARTECRKRHFRVGTRALFKRGLPPRSLPTSTGTYGTRVAGVLFCPGRRDARYQTPAVFGVAFGATRFVVVRGAAQPLEDGAAFLALVFVDWHNAVNKTRRLNYPRAGVPASEKPPGGFL